MEVIAYSPEVEEAEQSRRTDDILFNVRYLADNVADYHSVRFDPEAEVDVLEQNNTEIAEADVHGLGATVYQRRESASEQYRSLGAGTVDHAKKGRDALDLSDPDNWFEYHFRNEDVAEEERILEPEVQAGMRAGKIKRYVSPSPTHHEVDPDVAIAFGYDDRTMVQLQGLSPDGNTKTMKSFCVFDVPAKAWSEFLNAEYDSSAEPTALSVKRASGALPIEDDSFEDALTSLLQGVKPYLTEDQQESVDIQLATFLEDQKSLTEQVDYYAREKLAVQKELALSLGHWARPTILNGLLNVKDSLDPLTQMELSKRMVEGGLYVDEYVAKLFIKVSTVMTDVRAGLATHNHRTIQRVASSLGLEATLDLAQAEHFIQEAVNNDIDARFMVRRSEQQLAESGVSCGGGCAVDVVSLFSADALVAHKAGLKGRLYESKSLDKNSRCSCISAKSHRKAKVISDGNNVVCTTCGDYEKANGQHGSLAKAA